MKELKIQSEKQTDEIDGYREAEDRIYGLQDEICRIMDENEAVKIIAAQANEKIDALDKEKQHIIIDYQSLY